MKEEDSEQKLLGSIQVAQNKLARFLSGRKLQDKIPNRDIYKELKIPSVHQINAQIKLLEIWKSQHSDTYPTKCISRNEAIQDRLTRASNDNLLKESYGCKVLNSTFINDSARIWIIFFCCCWGVYSLSIEPFLNTLKDDCLIPIHQYWIRSECHLVVYPHSAMVISHEVVRRNAEHYLFPLITFHFAYTFCV